MVGSVTSEETAVMGVTAAGAAVRERLAFLREPPPTGMSRRVPPWVQ